MKRGLIILGFCLLLTALVWKRWSHPGHSLDGHAMGTRWVLMWRGKSPPPAILRKEVSSVLEKWEQVLSQWRPDSDLSKFNRGQPPTPDLARVLAMADEMKQSTGGAFDHHILEKVYAEGFGPPGKGVDLSSIGKGFAVDRVAERLRELGMKDFAFALAGEVISIGGEWPVEIERPDLGGAGPMWTIPLKNRAIATSGNYHQFRFDADGMKTHIIDPKTGKSVIRPPSSVTVIASDCATASSWATALFVLGPDFKDYPPTFEVSWQE